MISSSDRGVIHSNSQLPIHSYKKTRPEACFLLRAGNKGDLEKDGAAEMAVAVGRIHREISRLGLRPRSK